MILLRVGVGSHLGTVSRQFLILQLTRQVTLNVCVAVPGKTLTESCQDGDIEDADEQVRGSFLNRVGSLTTAWSTWIAGSVKRTRSFSTLLRIGKYDPDDDYYEGDISVEQQHAHQTTEGDTNHLVEYLDEKS